MSDGATPDPAALPAASDALGRGTSIGRYLVLGELGRGGMGEVYAAYDPDLDRRVALKLLHTAGGSESARKRLVREARALGKLSHPNVVQVHDVGEHQGDVFLAMELVDGQSLKAWCQGDPKPGWREVLGAYLEAARGLAAAHQKGLIHRDIKPANILRGNDGRVRVADFGLAAGQESLADEVGEVRAAAEEPAGESAVAATSQDGGFDERLTATGAITGTPAYMAPEQSRRQKLGPEADQFSLCVSLYEGLYGVMPFTADEGAAPLAVLLQLYQRKMRGAPAAPPPGSPVPAWVHKALARGLSPRPEDRYPSLEALIAALSDDPEARRRARLRAGGLAALTVALLGVAILGWARSSALRDPCAHQEQQLAGVWDEGVKGRVRSAFLGTGRAYAEDTATRVRSLLDRYASDWVTMRTEVCEAYRGDKQKREVLTLRDVCLDRRRAQLQALTTLLGERSDAQVLDKAVPAAAGLYPLAYCADTAALTARVKPPEDPALRARVEEVQPRADRLEALFIAGKHKEGLALGEPLLKEVEGVAHAPLRAAVQYAMGRLRDGAGDYEGAKAILHDAIFTAAEAKDDHLAANAWTSLLLVVGVRQQRFEEAAALRAWGPAAVARAGDPALQVGWLNIDGGVLRSMGKYAEAKATLERAMDLAAKESKPDNLDLTASLNNLGPVLAMMGDYPQAKATFERALALREKAVGSGHPDVAIALNNLGNVLSMMGDYPQAKATFERALALREAALGPDHPAVGASLNSLGIVLGHMGDYARAKALHERALALAEKTVGPEHPDVALSLNNLGNVLFDMGDYPQAAATQERALAVCEKAFGPDHPEIAYVLVVLGRARVRLHQLDAAEVALSRALALREKALGAVHPDLVDPLLGLAEVRLARRKLAEAVPLLERALRLTKPEDQPETLFTLGDALWARREDRARARGLVEEARAAFARRGSQPWVATVTRWLAEHPSEGPAASPASTAR